MLIPDLIKKLYVFIRVISLTRDKMVSGRARAEFEYDFLIIYKYFNIEKHLRQIENSQVATK